MDFKEILNSGKDTKNIYLGFNDEGIMSIDYTKTPSLIITGETGAGKSILLDQIILQLMNRYTSLEMGLICIDTSGVELNHYDNRYLIDSAINDINKSIVLISRVLKEIDIRKNALKDNNCLTIDEYNKYNDNKFPLLVVAIDEDKFLLRNEDIEKMLSGIITQLAGLNIIFILATSDVHNKFFETDSNVFASMLISFDYTNKEEAIKANVEDSENLGIGEFIAKSKDINGKYHNFEFDDNMIEEIVSK